MSTISVIIPAYNRQAYLGEAIESVLTQSRPAEEIIVVDDGSTDRTGDIARSYGDTVICIPQENLGRGAARNTGIAHARGELIAFLDSDDLWLQGKLEAQAAILDSRPDLAAVFCRMKAFLSPELEPAQLPRFDDREMDACNAQSILARREAVAKLGPFPTQRDIPEFLPWFARAGELGLTHDTVPALLLLRRVHLSNSVNDPEWRLRYLRFAKDQADRRRLSNPQTR